MMKTCSKCGQNRSIEHFTKHKSAKDGLRAYCKDCAKAYRALPEVKQRSNELQRTRRALPKNKEKSRCIEKERYWADPEKAKKRVTRKIQKRDGSTPSNTSLKIASTTAILKVNDAP